MQESRQGRERDFSFLSPPTCLCMQEPSTRTDSLALLWQLLLFVPLNTAAKAQTSPCLLSPKLQNREQRDRTQQVDPGAGVCIVFFTTLLPKDQQNRGSMCRILFTDSSTWNYFTPPFPKSKTLQVCTGLDYGKNPSLEKHFIQVLPCLPQLKAVSKAAK